MPAFFANQLGDFQINFVITDTLHLAIEPKGTRKVQLKLDIPPTLFKNGYALVSPIQIIPDSVTLEGPLRLLTALSDPVYLKIPQGSLDDNFKELIEVRLPYDRLIKRDPLTVDVSFQVDKLIEVTDSVQIEVINAPKQSWPFVERKKLPCTLAVPQTMMNFYNTDSIKAVVDLERFSRGERRLLPKLKGLPPFTQIIALDSIFIKY